MHRQHIHFSPGLPGDERNVSGPRKNAEVALVIDMDSALKDGVKFFLSENNVILTRGLQGALPPKYIKKVVDLTSSKRLTHCNEEQYSVSPHKPVGSERTRGTQQTSPPRSWPTPDSLTSAT